MTQPKIKPSKSTLDKMLGEASWLLSHAEALADYGREDEAANELARAAKCEEEVACGLDAAKREPEAAVHRVSAASCYQQLGEYARAVTLLRAALSASLPAPYRQRVEEQLNGCLALVHKEFLQLSSEIPAKSAQPELSDQVSASR
jgi:tetratricopeptide (TPR) repeat protein